jgi:hypothetical protein
MGRALGNWRTTVAGIGAIVAAAVSFLTGDGSLTMDQVVALLAGAGLIGAKDATTGSAPQ